MWDFIKRLFEGDNTGYESVDFLPISDPMPESTFWQIIDNVNKKVNANNFKDELLETELADYSLKNTAAFHLQVQRLANRATSVELWCAADLLTYGVDEDGFLDFRYWLIGSGRLVYDAAIANPDSLVSMFNEEELYDFNELGYVPNELFKKRSNQNMFDYLNFETFEQKFGSSPKVKKNWSDADINYLKSVCPLLGERAWEE